MKRPIGPFAVEYKRRSKLTKPAATASIWGEALGDEMKSFLRADAEPSEAPAKPGKAPKPARVMGSEARGRAKGARPVRILETRDRASAAAGAEDASDPDPAPAAPEEPAPVKARGRPAKRTAAATPPADIEAAPPPAPEPASIDEATPPIPDEDWTPAPVPDAVARPALANPTTTATPSRYSLRRRAQTKGLDFAERWRWNLTD